MPEDGKIDDASGREAPDDAKRVDEDWKRAAREEAEKYDQSDAGKTSDLPEPSFAALLTGFATQALMNLGAIRNPFSGKRDVDIAAARYTIDLLGILEEKCLGNLTEDEQKYMGSMLYDLRMRFVELSKSGGVPPEEESEPGGTPEGSGAGPTIITPPGVN